MLKLFRNHWFDLAILLAIMSIFNLLFEYQSLSKIQIIMHLNLIALFLHQFEEFRLPGNFPKTINTLLFNSKRPLEYPFSPKIAMITNVCLNWTLFYLATIFGADQMWLCVAVIMMSLGGFFSHAILFNILGRTLYNPGMLTATFLLLPVSIMFISVLVAQNHYISGYELVSGVLLGAFLDYFAVLKITELLKDKSDHEAFEDQDIQDDFNVKSSFADKKNKSKSSSKSKSKIQRKAAVVIKKTVGVAKKSGKIVAKAAKDAKQKTANATKAVAVKVKSSSSKAVSGAVKKVEKNSKKKK